MNQLTVIARAAGSSHSSTLASGSPATSLSEDARAFLQRRVASVGLVMAGVFGAFLIFRVVVTLTDAQLAYSGNKIWEPVPFLGATVLSFLTLWLSCRGRPRSLTAIRRLELGCFLVGCTACELMPFVVPYAVRPDYIVLMALGMVFVSRAVYVPTTARRTFLLGGTVGLPLLGILYFVHLYGHDPADYAPSAFGFVHLSPPEWAVRWVMIDVLWWMSFVVIGTAASHVIYGLREEVRDARKLGQYTLIEKLGEGGMGAVYRASHAMLRRPAAVKLLPPDRFGPQNFARFEREVQLTASLSHPNTVRVYDYGRTPDGIFYYAMEFLDGANLGDVIAVGGAMSAGRVIQILDQVAGALAEAHGVGLIHRDIKPANILLTELGGVPDVVKVVDFGLVKEIGPEPVADAATVQAITQANTVAGTPHYMAPEAISAPAKVDARCDIYALGAVGYFLVTGRDVFSGRNSFEVFGHHLHSKPVPPSDRLGGPVPADLERLILACLAKSPDDRPSSARALQDELRRLRDAHAWSEDDARQWWAQYGDAARAKRVHVSVGIGATMTVALDVRAAGA